VNLHRTLAISRRIVHQFRRDHRTLALLFVAPVVILGLLGWVIRDQQAPTTRLAIVDPAPPAGLAIRTALASADATIVFVDGVADEAAATALLADDGLDVAIVLPDSLLADIAAGRSPTIRVLTPGVVPSDDAARMAAVGSVLARGLSSAAPLPTIEHEAVFGSADADILDAFAPALIGFFAYFLVFILTGVSFLRERVGGTLERLLATPIMRSEIVAGYAAGFGLFATLQVIVIMLFSLGTLSMPALGPLPAFSIGLGIANAGSPVLAFAVVLLLALGAVSLGILISTFARTELQILQFIPIVIVPQGLLSGIFWPVESLPDALEVVARALPLTYAVDGLREVLVKGADLASPALQLDLGVLAGIAVLLVALATLTIRREVA
jgi:ABC-2 type transport system permease protein